VDLVFETRGDRFADDRRDAFQGLSEREAAELIARSLITQWNLKPAGSVPVVRVSGAPYAAAWIDGQLRLNPSFVYLAAAPTR
jgi:ABC-type sugar transport system substrate-binding protein